MKIKQTRTAIALIGLSFLIALVFVYCIGYKEFIFVMFVTLIMLFLTQSGNFRDPLLKIFYGGPLTQKDLRNEIYNSALNHYGGDEIGIEILKYNNKNQEYTMECKHAHGNSIFYVSYRDNKISYRFE